MVYYKIYVMGVEARVDGAIELEDVGFWEGGGKDGIGGGLGVFMAGLYQGWAMRCWEWNCCLRIWTE